MASGKQDFMEAIRNGDVDYLRQHLRRYPEDLTEQLAWDSYGGLPLHYAAFVNQPQVISMLILEFHADPNWHKGVGADWVPLNHAKEKSACDAAGMLVSLGADPSLAIHDLKGVEDFCKSRQVQQRSDPGHAARQKQLGREQTEKRIAGDWKRTGEREITHDYEQPAIGCRLLDIFNFETRCLRSLVKSTDGPGVAQNIVFFDDMPDREILREPAEKLKALGGDIGEDETWGGRILKKSSLPRP